MSKNSTEAPSRTPSQKDGGKYPEGRNRITKNWPGWAAELFGWVEVIVVAAALAWFLTQFIIINATVPSGSMQDTIQPGDRLFGLRLTYLFSKPKRGDIVVFRYPVDDAMGKKTNYIKRIIGLPGETVELRDGKIYIDGSDTPLDESYIMNEPWEKINDSDDVPLYNGDPFVVPEDCYLMLGDHRNNSSDARYWAEIAYTNLPAAGIDITVEEAKSLSYVKRSQILGKAYVRYWPLTKISLLK